MAERPVQIPRRFRSEVSGLAALAAAAEANPMGPRRADLVDHLEGIRSRISPEDPAEFRSVIARESSAALMLGAPSVNEIREANRVLVEIEHLEGVGKALRGSLVADLASTEIATAIVSNDRGALVGALSRGDDSDIGAGLLAQTGLALSLVPAIAPDLMATALGTPREFTSAIPGWERRVAAHGALHLDPLLLPLAEARLHVLRSFSTQSGDSPSAVERLAEAVLLVERIAPSTASGNGSRWARSAPFAVLAVGTVCSVVISSMALLGRTVPGLRESAEALIQLAASRELSSVDGLCDTANWLELQIAEMTGAARAGLRPRSHLGQYEDVLRPFSDLDSTLGATQVIARDVGLVTKAAQKWSG